MFENIFEAADHQRKDTGVVYYFTKTAPFIASAMRKHLAVHLSVGSFLSIG